MILSSSDPGIINFDPFNTSTQQQHQLGALIELADRRAFRYARAGATALSAGKIDTAPIQKTNHQNQAVQAAAAIGVNTVSLTLGATASTDNEYAEGYFSVGLTPGQGHVYKISYQPATSSAGTQSLTLFDNIQVALTTSSKASLIHNSHNGTVEGTTQTVRPAGVPMTPVTGTVSTPTSATYVPQHYWGQTSGVASVLNDQAIALGSWLTMSASVSGAVIAMSGTYATALLTPKVGEMTIKVGVDTQYEPVFLSIDLA